MLFETKENGKRDVVGIGCAVLIVHTCFQHVAYTLPLCDESLDAKSYKFFYIYEA